MEILAQTTNRETLSHLPSLIKKQELYSKKDFTASTPHLSFCKYLRFYILASLSFLTIYVSGQNIVKITTSKTSIQAGEPFEISFESFDGDWGFDALQNVQKHIPKEWVVYGNYLHFSMKYSLVLKCYSKRSGNFSFEPFETKLKEKTFQTERKTISIHECKNGGNKLIKDAETNHELTKLCSPIFYEYLIKKDSLARITSVKFDSIQNAVIIQMSALVDPEIFTIARTDYFSLEQQEFLIKKVFSKNQWFLYLIATKSPTNGISAAFANKSNLKTKIKANVMIPRTN